MWKIGKLLIWITSESTQAKKKFTTQKASTIDPNLIFLKSIQMSKVTINTELKIEKQLKRRKQNLKSSLYGNGNVEEVDKAI